MLNVDSILNLSKGFNTKRKKEGDADTVFCTLKFDECQIQCDAGDELLGMPIGWLEATHYDAQGAPLRPFTLSNKRSEFQVNAVIRGTKDTEGKLSLTAAVLTDVEIRLGENWVYLAGVLSWEARGDEVEDLALLLGKTCGIKGEIDWSKQEELLPRAAPPEPDEKFNTMMQRLRGPKPNQDQTQTGAP